MSDPGVFDKGGYLLPGWVLAVNRTGRAERILPPPPAPPKVSA